MHGRICGTWHLFDSNSFVTAALVEVELCALLGVVLL